MGSIPVHAHVYINSWCRPETFQFGLRPQYLIVNRHQLKGCLTANKLFVNNLRILKIHLSQGLPFALQHSVKGLPAKSLINANPPHWQMEIMQRRLQNCFGMPSSRCNLFLLLWIFRKWKIAKVCNAINIHFEKLLVM